jgi:hypothetical protein
MRTAYITNESTKKKEIQRATLPKTILDIDIKKILRGIETRYKVKLPKNIIALDYGEKGDLYIRFKHVEKPIGDPTKDGLVIFFFHENDKQRVVALEILDITRFVT